jgi:seryl-tRNA synthetase
VTRGEKIGWGTVAIVSVVALAILWRLGMTAADDKTQAALIAAASALSVASVTLTGGLLTAFRTQSLAGRVALGNERRLAYSRFLTAADRFRGAQSALTRAKEQRDDLDKLISEKDSQVRPEDEKDAYAKELDALVNDLETLTAEIDTAATARSAAMGEMNENLSMAILIASPKVATQLQGYASSVLRTSAETGKLRQDLLKALKEELGVPRPR